MLSSLPLFSPTASLTPAPQGLFSWLSLLPKWGLKCRLAEGDQPQRSFWPQPSLSGRKPRKGQGVLRVTQHIMAELEPELLSQLSLHFTTKSGKQTSPRDNHYKHSCLYLASVSSLCIKPFNKNTVIHTHCCPSALWFSSVGGGCQQTAPSDLW